jgi:uncharacterized protein (TIGR02265 family)
MRAAQTQSLLAAIGKLRPRERDDIFGRIGEGDVRQAEDALPVTWLPMSLHMRISDHLRDVVGPTRNVAVWRDAMLQAFERPFLRGFVMMSVAVFGLTPGGLLRRADRVYEHITRELGTVHFEPDGPRSGSVELRGFPASRYRFICYVEGLAGCLSATISLCGARERVFVTRRDEAGSASYRVSWHLP